MPRRNYWWHEGGNYAIHRGWNIHILLHCPLFTHCSQSIIQLLFVALGDSDPQVQSNSAFALGMLVENTEADLSSQYLHFLSALRPLFQCPEGAPAAHFNARDNATGAVARMIIKKTEAVPLDQVRLSLVSRPHRFLTS